MSNPPSPCGPDSPGSSANSRNGISELKELVEKENKDRPVAERFVFKSPNPEQVNGEWVYVQEYTSTTTGKHYRGEGRSTRVKKEAGQEACRIVMDQYYADKQAARMMSGLFISGSTSIRSSFTNSATLPAPVPGPVPIRFSSTEPVQNIPVMSTLPQSVVTAPFHLRILSDPGAVSPLKMTIPTFKTPPVLSLPSQPSHPAINVMLPTGPETRVAHSIFYYQDTRLGQGGMGIVYQGYFEVRDRHAAVKLLSFGMQQRKVEVEIDILRKLNHGNIIRYFASETDAAGSIFIAMELADGNLEQAIKSESCEQLQKYLIQTGSGLEYLHSSNIIHRDLKPNNVLIFGGVTAKIADFGISRAVESITLGAHTVQMMGSHRWMPPESSGLGNWYSYHGDIFAFGLIIFYTMSESHQHAFEDKDFPAVTSPRWSELGSSNHYFAAKSLLTPMLSKDLNIRPKIEVILQHPFFWDGKKFIEFVTGSTNELKKAGKEVRLKMDYDYDNFCLKELNSHVNWKMRLCPQVRLYLLERPNHYKSYDAGSLMSLLELIRDKFQHQEEWRSKDSNPLKDVLGVGANDPRYGDYFKTKFPELASFLYGALQGEEFQSILTKVKQEFYKAK